jgi:hypothetical protein
MRTLFVVALLAGASVAIAADEKQQAPAGSQNTQQNPPNANEQVTPAEKDRVRAEGAAGGTKPVPPERRKAVGAGAGPHRRDQHPSPSRLPADQPVEPAK